jgi:hypothetical protein
MLVRKAGEGNGPEAWRLLSHRFGRHGDSDQMNVYKNLVKSDLGTMATCLGRLHALHVFVQMHNAAHPSEEVPEALIRSVLRENAPEPLRSHIKISVPLSVTLHELCDRMEEYLLDQRPFSLSHVLPETDRPSTASAMDVPMDVVGYIGEGFGKGDAFGKGKGKGKAFKADGATAFMGRVCFFFRAEGAPATWLPVLQDHVHHGARVSADTRDFRRSRTI